MKFAPFFGVVMATATLHSSNPLPKALLPHRIDKSEAFYHGGSMIAERQERTVWRVIKNNGHVSRFAALLEENASILDLLDSIGTKFTAFVPSDEAFADVEASYPVDLPSFFWSFLLACHIGPGAYSSTALLTNNTVPLLQVADIYNTYQQRLSIQAASAGTSVNYDANISKSDAAVNGNIHYINKVLLIPEPLSYYIRGASELTTLHLGLRRTNVAMTINDTSTHIGQTLFAPSNVAFESLGPAANKFLFSDDGTRYLKAILEYHIVSNYTVFTDVYYNFNERNGTQILLINGSKVQLPTLINHHNLSISVSAENSRAVLRLNDVAEVVQGDRFIGFDGVIQVIDKVLLPAETHNGIADKRSKSDGGEISVEDLVEAMRPFV